MDLRRWAAAGGCPHIASRPLRGAEAPLFHRAARVLLVSRKIKINVQGVGEECPTLHSMMLVVGAKGGASCPGHSSR
jgi:hypothetical protein